MRAAVRQDPDVILVGEMRDRETMEMALDAAEMGFLVFGTLHTNGAAKAIDRVCDLFPPEQQMGVRFALASNLKAVVSQLLLKKARGEGRCAVCEVLVGIPAVENLIREGKTAQLYSLMQRGSKHGMQTMDQGLLEAVKNHRINPESAYRKANDKGPFEPYVKVRTDFDSI
jgi:twitching motility protein PilT